MERLANYEERRALLGCEPLWTRTEVAAYLGLSERSVERLDVPRVRLGAAVRWDPETVKRWARLQMTHQLPP
jgi:hypothetical protein